MTDRELFEKALEALEEISGGYSQNLIAALRERLAQPEQEPVAWIYAPTVGDGPKERRLTFVPPHEWGTQLCIDIVPLYTSPPQRKPLPLKEVERLIYKNTKINPNVADDRELLGYIVNAARSIEAAHGIKEKNNG